ncbi:MAG: quinoprotein dehydrogenase-associated putative ABC transporter substrate-binding protein, partial [Pseudolabrys sp.]
GMGVRYSDQNWKRQLNQLIQAKQPAITEILQSYGVPLIDEDNHLIEPASNAK